MSGSSYHGVTGLETSLNRCTHLTAVPLLVPKIHEIEVAVSRGPKGCLWDLTL